VESAIVLPLYVFLVLGMLQLGLMHQARLLTKYAAYKAVRAGSIHNGSVAAMEDAALAVLLPMASQSVYGGAETIRPANGAANFGRKWNDLAISGNNQMPDVGLKYAEVTICGPLRGDVPGGSGEVDFDDPSVASSADWQRSERTKLRVQVTFNYRMPIPFANMVIHRASRNRELPYVLRLNNQGPTQSMVGERIDLYSRIADGTGVYVLPIRATYTMRMQSNLYVNQAPLPDDNQCVFTFHY
jgi:hypothetical protein